MDISNKEYTALQWALGEASRELSLSENALRHNQKHEPYKRDVEVYRDLSKSLESLIKKAQVNGLVD